LVKADPFTDEYVFDVSKRTSDKVIGYMAYMKTTSGFEKYYYMSKEDALAHGKKYSKSFSSGVWNSDPDAMGRKTCLKLLLSKFGILSIELQRAIKFDQGVVKGDFSQMESIEDIDAVEVDYIDNPQNGVDEKKAAETAAKFADFDNVTDRK
jgi:recombination protein RecT